MQPTSRWPVLALAAGTSAAYGLIGLFRHWHFSSSAFDLGLFDQVVWHLSRFETPASTIGGYANIFGDHFHPIILLFAPAYWIYSGPETLIVMQSLLLGASVIPVHAFARSRLPAGPALAMTVAYALFWGMQRTAWFDVHEVAFAPLFIAGAVLALDRRRWGWLWLACGLLMLVKEDQIPIVMGLGVYAAIAVDRRRGLWLAAVAGLWFLLVLRVVIPAFNPAGVFTYQGPFQEVIARPWMAPLLAITPIEKIRLVAYWLLPFLFLPLRSPLALLLLPIAAERLLSSAPNHWSAGYHYSASLAPLLAMAAADGLARLTRNQPLLVARRWTIGACASAIIVSAVLPGHQPVLRLFAAKHYRPVPDRADAKRALAAIPPEASVVAEAAIAPHLSQRDRIYILAPKAPDADYVIATTDVGPRPNADHAAIAALLAERWNAGYSTVVESGGWVVLKRQSSR